MPDKKERIDIHKYLAEFEDIPGTRVFTAQRARKGYWLNQFAMSLMKRKTATVSWPTKKPISTSGI